MKGRIIGCILLAGLTIGWAQEEVVVPEDSTAQATLLQVGDLAPSWALMYAPGKFEYLRNWTIEKDGRLKRFTTQPERHVVIMSFFATWCKPCMKELPHLENLYRKYQNEKVKFFLVDITEATRTSPGFEDAPEAGPFLAEKGITMQVLNDSRGVVKKNYGVATLPRLFVVDKYQTIRLMKQGFHEGEDFEGDLIRAIDELLAEADKD
ncbi:MAG: TlpA disulfide reductase family protein [Candidatus Neomarinimicrobiota bacterium]